MKKRILAGTLSLCMLISFFPTSAFALEDEQQRVICLGAQTPRETECLAQTHEEGCPMYTAPAVTCTKADDCAADEHDAECPKYVAPVVECTKADDCAADEHDAECPKYVAPAVECTKADDCAAETHDAECPKYKVEITGGTFNGMVDKVDADSVLTINGGTFNVDSEEELRSAVDLGASNIVLKDDIELTTMLNIKKPVTIDGENHTVTSSAKKVFEICSDTYLKDTIIVNSADAGRCVDTRVDNINVVLDNVILNATGTGNTQPITIGGSETDGLNLTIKNNSNIDAGKSGYGIISFVPATVEIVNSKISGYAALYVKPGSNGIIFNVKNSDLIGKNEHPAGSNDFCTIAFDDRAFVNIEGGTVKAITTNTSAHSIFDGCIDTNSIITLNDTEVVCEGDKAVVCFDGDNYYKIKASGKSVNAFVAKIGEYYYPTLAAAISAVPTNGTETTVTLLKNATVEGRIIVNDGRNVKLDLNGNDVLSNDNFVFDVYNAKFHVTGQGTIFENVEDGYAPILGRGSNVDNGPEYTVITIDKDVTLKGDYAGIFVARDVSGTYNNYGLVINMKGTIDMGSVADGVHECGIYVNGQNNVTTGNVMKINLDGARINNGKHGIYQAGYADTTIGNGTVINGENTGIEIRAGKLTVNNAAITGNGVPTKTESNGNGTTTDGAGIAVVQHTTKLPIDVTINNGATVAGHTALYQMDAEENGTEAIAKINITVNGGNFKAINGGTVSVYSQNKTGFIKSGYFVNDPTPYVDTTRYLVLPSDNEDYTYRVEQLNLDNAAAKIGDTPYKTLEDAITAANGMTAGTIVTMLDDWAYQTNGTGLLNITNSITLDGNGHKITGYGSRGGNKTTLAINNGGTNPVTVTLENLTIENNGTNGRPVETRGNITKLNIDNCKFYANGGGNTQVLTIGGSQSTLARVIISGSTLSAGESGYPIIMFNPVNMQIESSSFEGYCSLYFKGAVGSGGSHGSVVTANNTTFDAPNIHDSNGGYNNFGVFTLEDDDIDITLNSCEVNCKSESTAEQGLVLASSYSDRKSKGYNVTLKDNTEVKGKLLYDNGWNNENCHLNIESGSYTLQAWKIGSNDKAFNITGGTFNIEPKDVYLADGYEYKPDGSNYIIGKHNLVSVAETPATCATTGTAAHYKCEFCGKLYSDTADKTEVTAESLVIAATGVHTFGEWTTVTPAACLTKGTEKHVCSVCNAEETRDIPAKGHNYSEWRRVTDPTCVAEGQDVSSCRDCGNKRYASVAVIAHTYGVDGKCIVCGNFDATKVIATPTPAPTPTPTATPEPEATPAPTPTPAPIEADTTVTEVVATEEVIEAVKEMVTVTEGKADIELDTAEKVIELTETGKELVFPITETTEEVVNKVEVSSDALETLANEETDIVIQLTDATVKLDKEAVAAVKEQAGDRNIEIRAVKTETATLTETQQSAIADKDTAVVVTAQIFADGEYVGDFKGGKATIMLPFTPDEGKAAEDYTVYYIAEDGSLTQVASEYVDGYMVFTTGHFSDYIIVYEKTELSGGNVLTPDKEQTNKSMPIIPIAVVAVIVIAGAFVMASKKKREE